MATLFDRVGMATATTGTGTLTLGSALGAVAPNLATFQSFAGASVPNGTVTSYLIVDANGNWEVGTGIYSSSGTTLTRTVTASSNAGSPISLSGNAQVFITIRAEDLEAASSSGAGGYVNKFRNATLDVWQRGGTISSPASTGVYTADGWIVIATGANVSSVTKAAGRLLTASSLIITGNTSVTDAILRQRIESLTAAPFASQTVTIQFQIYNSTGGSITPTLSVGHPTSVDTYSAIGSASLTNEVNAASLQACPNAQFTQCAYTFAVSASAANGLEVNIDFGNNLGSNAQYVQVCEFDIRVTSGAPAGLNSTPPVPELRPIGVELPLNQRYFWQKTAAVNFYNYANGYTDTTTHFTGILNYPVPMRAAPTFTSTATATFDVIDGTGLAQAVSSGPAFTLIGADSARVAATVASGLTAGQGGTLNDAGSSASWIAASAEL